MPNVAKTLSRYQVALGEDHRDLSFKSFENLEEALLVFYEDEEASFFLELAQITEIPKPGGSDPVKARYDVIANKGPGVKRHVDLLVTGDFERVREVVLN